MVKLTVGFYTTQLKMGLINKGVNMYKITLVLINLIFGSLLLFSYYNGVTKNPDLSAKLWGGVPESLRTFIVASMFISAIGYFFFTTNFVLNVNLEEKKFLGKFPGWTLHIVYLLILIPSALWIDLTFQYLKTGVPLHWVYVLSALYCVGLSSILLFLFVVDSGNTTQSIYLFSVIGAGFFVFHTMFLDGLLWTIFFHSPFK